jgi:hypothetical protein
VSRLRTPATRGELWTTLVIVGLCVGFVVSKPVRRKLAEHPSSDACAALLDRYVEHVVHAIDPKPPVAELTARKAQARDLAAGDPAFARCPSYLTREEAECAMRAGNADEFERCLP